MTNETSEQSIERRICFIRGRKVMLDRDLAELYGVPTGALNRAVRRNSERFPGDFMFTLTASEWNSLKCQIGISSWGGDRRALPSAFTEEGVAMLSGVLRSKRAIHVNIAIMRAFCRLREMVAVHRILAQRLKDLESQVIGNTTDIEKIFQRLRELAESPMKRIPGFREQP